MTLIVRKQLLLYPSQLVHAGQLQSVSHTQSSLLIQLSLTQIAGWATIFVEIKSLNIIRNHKAKTRLVKGSKKKK